MSVLSKYVFLCLGFSESKFVNVQESLNLLIFANSLHLNFKGPVYEDF